MQSTLDCKTWVEVDRRALLHNFKTLSRYIGGMALLPMVKSNAYGHGLTVVGKVLQKAGARFLGVDNIDEALQLRQAGVRVPVLIFSFTPKHRLRELLEHELSQVVYDLDTLDSMRRLSKKAIERFHVHLKFDTGMSRQGVRLPEASKYAEFLSKNRKYIFFEGLVTHFADADNLKDQTFSHKQLAKFGEVVAFFKARALMPKFVHAFNTAATLNFARSHHVLDEDISLCRSGIGMYGLEPSKDFKYKIDKLKLLPVLTWKTRIVQIKQVPKGSYVGYGLTERTKKPLRVAILPVGYYEGVPTSYASVGRVLVGGQKCKVLGRVSMNLTVVDVTAVHNSPRVWDEVVLIGKQGQKEITASEFARVAKTINYEIVARINPLIKRVLI